MVLCSESLKEFYAYSWHKRWPDHVLNDPALASRRKRSHNLKIISLDREKIVAVFRSSSKHDEGYVTTLTDCTCRDFALGHRNRPCKHIFRLAEELGVLHNEHFEDCEYDYTFDAKVPEESVCRDVARRPKQDKDVVVRYDNVRPFKGRSFVDFPEEYCVVCVRKSIEDLGVCGMSEIGAVKFSGNENVGEFRSRLGPNAADELRAMADFLGGSIFVGAGIRFDINCLYDACWEYLQWPLRNDYIDIERIEGQMLKDRKMSDLEGYLLMRHADVMGIVEECLTLQNCFEALRQEALMSYDDLEGFFKAFKVYQPASPRKDFSVSECKTFEGWRQELRECSSIWKGIRFIDRLKLTIHQIRKFADYIGAEIVAKTKNGMIKNLVYEVIGDKVKAQLLRKRDVVRRDGKNGLIYRNDGIVELTIEVGVSSESLYGPLNRPSYLPSYEQMEKWKNLLMQHKTSAERIQLLYDLRLKNSDIREFANYLGVNEAMVGRFIKAELILGLVDASMNLG